MDKILSEIRDLISEVKEIGFTSGNTKELVGVNLIFRDVDLKSLYPSAKALYKSKFINKMNQERHHYSFLKYGLLQKIEYNKFYFNEEPIGSRKIIVHSEDCISTVQLLPRDKEMAVIISIRSSDVEKLLIADIAGVIEIIKELKYSIYKNKRIKVNISVMIGSAHVYMSDGDPRRRRRNRKRAKI